MKKVNITVSFDDQKLDALTFFMRKDDTDPQKSLQVELEKLYEKYIPTEMREYLESRAPAPAKERPRRPARPATPKVPAAGARPDAPAAPPEEARHD